MTEYAEIDIELGDAEWAYVQEGMKRLDMTLDEFIEHLIKDALNELHGGVSCSHWGIFRWV